MSNLTLITSANGDGSGVEIMSACLVIAMGEKVYLSGNSAGYTLAQGQ